MSISVYKPNRLAYAGNRLAGADSAHVVFTGNPSLVTSVLPASGGIYKIIPGFKLTSGVQLLGTPTTGLDGRIGSVFNCTSGNGRMNFSGFSVDLTRITFACIVVLTKTSGLNVFIDEAISADFLCITNGTFGIAYNNTRTDLSALPSGVIGAPYFYAVSGKSSAVSNAVLVRLDTGQTTSTSFTPGAFGSTTSPDFGFGGTTAAAFNSGEYAAFEASNNLLSIQQLLVWAADPWAFWYPRRVTDTVFDSLQTQTDILYPQSAF